MSNMDTMKAAAINAYGDTDAFEMMPVALPVAQPGEVLIKVAYAGVNPADWKFRQGLLAGQVHLQFPAVLGNDASGVVVAVGEGVTEFTPGDRVFAFTNITEGNSGGYAEYVAVSQERVAIVPSQVSLKSAAVIPCAALTGWQGLFKKERGDLQAGQKILINGGSGGLGSYAVQFAKWAGAEVAATCGSDNVEYVQSLGADLVIDYRNQTVRSELAKWAPEGVDIILDVVGAKSLPEAFSMIKSGGRLVSIPTMDMAADGDVAKDIEEAAKLGITKNYGFSNLEESGKDFEQIIALLAQGAIVDPAIEVFAIEDVSNAHSKLQSGHVRGKIVLEVAGDSIGGNLGRD